MLADLDSLPTNFLCAVGDAAANQLAAYILVRNSACKYASDSRAGQIFSTDRKFDEFAAQLVRNKDVPISLSGQERLTLFLPVGQIALLVAFSVYVLPQGIRKGGQSAHRPHQGTHLHQS